MPKTLVQQTHYTQKHAYNTCTHICILRYTLQIKSNIIYRHSCIENCFQNIAIFSGVLISQFRWYPTFTAHTHSYRCTHNTCHTHPQHKLHTHPQHLFTHMPITCHTPIHCTYHTHKNPSDTRTVRTCCTHNHGTSQTPVHMYTPTPTHACLYAHTQIACVYSVCVRFWLPQSDPS